MYESIDHIIVSQSKPNSIYANNRWTPFGIQIVDVIVASKDAFAAIFKHVFLLVETPKKLLGLKIFARFHHCIQFYIDGENRRQRLQLETRREVLYDG